MGVGADIPKILSCQTFCLVPTEFPKIYVDFLSPLLLDVFSNVLISAEIFTKNVFRALDVDDVYSTLLFKNTLVGDAIGGSDIGISELFFQNIGILEREKMTNIGVSESKIVNTIEFAKYRISECV